MITPLRCLVVDDQPHCIQRLKKDIEKTEGLIFEAGETDALHAKDLIVSKKIIVDLVFLDIDMPEINGIALAKLIKDFAMVIFVTGYKSYAFDAYETDAVDYLHKPVVYERFLMAVTKARDRMVGKVPTIAPVAEVDAVFVRLESKSKMVKILLAEIVYVKGGDNYIFINQVNGSKVITHSTLKNFQEQLPSQKFVRIHKSFVVNIAHVNSITGNMVFLIGGIELPIGQTYRNELLERLKML